MIEKVRTKIDFDTILHNVREKSPIIHNITNYVTVNDCANILLACGASPIMADDIEEVSEITSLCGGLNINIGTLNHNSVKSMLAAGKRANELGHPAVLDPVGAGASRLRTETALKLIDEIRFDVIRGNISEIKTLAACMQAAGGKDAACGSSTVGGCGSSAVGSTKGVDADIADKVTEENLDSAVAFVKEFSEKTGAVIAVTGAIDIVAGDGTAYIIRNGHPMMSSITGTGCQLSALTAAFVTANRDCVPEAAAAAVIAMGVCGETAFKRLGALDGNATYRNYIIDAVYRLTPEDLKRGADYEMR